MSQNGDGSEGSRGGMGEFAEALTGALAEGFRNLRVASAPPFRLSRFSGSPRRAGDITLKEWLTEVDIYCRQYDLEGGAKASAMLDHLRGAARDEVLCMRTAAREDPAEVIRVLKDNFGPPEDLQSLSARFHNRVQNDGETLRDFSRSLIRAYDKMLKAVTDDQRGPLEELKDVYLKGTFAKGARDPKMQVELKKLEKETAGRPFSEMRERFFEIFGERDPPAPRSQSHVREVTATRSDDDPVSSHPVVQSLVKAQRDMTTRQQRIEENQSKTNEKLDKLLEQNSKPQCAYCKKFGHVFRNCLKRKADMERRERAGSANQQAAAGQAVRPAMPSDPLND